MYLLLRSSILDHYLWHWKYCNECSYCTTVYCCCVRVLLCTEHGSSFWCCSLFQDFSFTLLVDLRFPLFLFLSAFCLLSSLSRKWLQYDHVMMCDFRYGGTIQQTAVLSVCVFLCVCCVGLWVSHVLSPVFILDASLLRLLLYFSCVHR